MPVINENRIQAQKITEQMIEGNISHNTSPQVGTRIIKRKSAYLFMKRIGDIVSASLGLVLLSPLFLAVAVAIKLDSKGPVFFTHTRIGQNSTELRLYKFRTMRPNAAELFSQFTPEQKKEFEENYKLDNDPRITRIGGFLRGTSLDELPQLLNILQGNLSIVGPRPLVEKEIDKYGADKFRLLSVKPGLTGNWQVNGRNSTTYEERMALELYYVDNASLWFDIKILLQTVPAVMLKIGAK